MTDDQNKLGGKPAKGYAVGYGKPPASARFKKGQSGNPKGRPKGVRNFATDVRETLKAPVRVTRNGKPKSVSTQEAMLLRLREQALSGNARSLDRYLQLAQKYNGEELAEATAISGDDAVLLDVYNARLLSGASGTNLSSESSDTRSSEDQKTKACSNDNDREQREGESINSPAKPARDQEDK
jgi:hypothetical protein